MPFSEAPRYIPHSYGVGALASGGALTSVRGNNMPTYEYQCQACGHRFDILQKITEGPLTRCPKCQRARLKRLIGAGLGVIFKGSGFYSTDNRRGGSNGSSSKSESKGESKKESKTESKSESSSESKSKAESKTA